MSNYSLERAEDFSGSLNRKIKLNFTATTRGGRALAFYGAQIKKLDEEKEQYIQQALTILTSSDKAPLEKADAIMGVPGFGPNTATGLVMLIAPTEFAIWNKQSKTALKKFGYAVHNLDTFQKSIRPAIRGVGRT